MREWVFRWRGYVLVPTAALVVLVCRPTPGSFALGLAIAVFGEMLRMWGVGYSGTTTRERQVVAPQLVTAGPYAYVRNPLYLGNFITATGFLVVGSGDLSWVTRLALTLLMVLSYTTVYGLIIPLEEEYLGRTFGQVYFDYQRAVPRLIPRFSPYARRRGFFDWRVIKTAEIHTLILFLVMVSLMAARLLMELRVWELILRG